MSSSSLLFQQEQYNIASMVDTYYIVFVNIPRVFFFVSIPMVIFVVNIAILTVNFGVAILSWLFSARLQGLQRRAQPVDLGSAGR